MAPTPKALNEALIRGLPDTGPVVMVNLVRLRERAADGNGSGWDAYVRYSRAFVPLLKACGGAILWAGNAEGVAFGELGAARWDYVVLVQYPSRAAFLDTLTSAAYAEANLERENGLEDHVILSVAETYSRLGSK
jgi:uncharacterized protein (DUF1330 family)